jgi:hypothetical protein
MDWKRIDGECARVVDSRFFSERKSPLFGVDSSLQMEGLKC